MSLQAMLIVMASITTIMTAICLAVVFTTRQSYKIGWEASHIKAEFARIDARFENANKWLSTLASTVQAMPDEMRKEFMLKGEALSRWEDYQIEHRRLDDRLHVVEITLASVKTSGTNTCPPPFGTPTRRDPA